MKDNPFRLLTINDFYIALADDFPFAAGFFPLQFLNHFTAAVFLSLFDGIFFPKPHRRSATVAAHGNFRFARSNVNGIGVLKDAPFSARTVSGEAFRVW